MILSQMHFEQLLEWATGLLLKNNRSSNSLGSLRITPWLFRGVSSPGWGVGRDGPLVEGEGKGEGVCGLL